MGNEKIAVFQATSICAECKGRCCRLCGCHYSPDDFADKSFDALKAEIEKGKISIDWWEAEPREYFLRSRHVGEPIVCGSWGGVCVNLTENGCSLPWDERPLGGKALKPRETLESQCITSYGKEDCKNDWKKYDTVLRELAEYFELGGIGC